MDLPAGDQEHITGILIYWPVRHPATGFAPATKSIFIVSRNCLYCLLSWLSATPDEYPLKSNYVYLLSQV